MSARSSLDRIAVNVGVASIVSAGFALATGEFVFVRMQGWSIAVAVVLGALAVLAGWIGRRILVLVVGLGFLIASVAQVALWASGQNWLGGTGSTASLWLGFGIAVVVAGLATHLWPDRSSSPPASASPAGQDSPSATGH